MFSPQCHTNLGYACHPHTPGGTGREFKIIFEVIVGDSLSFTLSEEGNVRQVLVVTHIIQHLEADTGGQLESKASLVYVDP